MNLNPNVRTECLETLLNPTEMNSFGALCKLLGVSKSAYNRALINGAVHSHGTAMKPSKESRGCPGRGHVASRGNLVKGAVSGRRSW